MQKAARARKQTGQAEQPVTNQSITGQSRPAEFVLSFTRIS